MSQFFRRVISLISKPAQMRGDQEIAGLLPWLRKRSDLLAGMKKDVMADLIRHCQYQPVSRDHVIIKQGDIGDCFYIMLTGKTSVYIDTTKTDDDPPADDNHQPSSEDPGNTDTSPGTSNKADTKKKKLDRSQYGKFIINFDAGKAFGELALMNEDSVRNASIIADEETDLLVINRDLFNRSLKAKQEQEYQERRDFINNQPLFRNWNAKFKRLLEMSLRKEVFSFGDYIVKQGEQTEGIYFIIRGQAKVSISPASHSSQYPRFYDGSQSVFAKELGQKLQKRHISKSRDNLVQEHVVVRRKQGYAAAEKRRKEKSIDLCFINTQEIIGDTEVILGLETYFQSVICTTHTEVFLLNNENIERLITKKHLQTLERLRLLILEKLNIRIHSKVGANMEIYKHLIQMAHEIAPKKKTQENKNNGKSDEEIEKELVMQKLCNLFMKDKASLVTPHVPGMVYYMTKSAEKAQQLKQKKAKIENQRKFDERRDSLNIEARLGKARRTPKRRPRSRRELAKLSFSQPVNVYSKMLYKQMDVSSSDQGALALRTPSVGFFGGGQAPKYADDNHQQDRVFKMADPAQSSSNLPLTPNQPGKSALDVSAPGGARVIASALERMSTQKPVSNMRPKSAPTEHWNDSNTDAENEQDCFDFDTGNTALTSLEERMRSFHENQWYGNATVRGDPYRIVPLKRFTIDVTEDMPVPGGTVFVRQKSCSHSSNIISTGQHDHIRRFVIPKNAFQIATESLEQMSKLAAEKEALNRERSKSVVGRGTSRQKHGYRPKSSLTISW